MVEGSTVEALSESPDIAVVASKVLDWDGERIDYVDGGLTWYGMGYKPHVGKPDDGAHDTARDVLFDGGADPVVVRPGIAVEEADDVASGLADPEVQPPANPRLVAERISRACGTAAAIRCALPSSEALSTQISSSASAGQSSSSRSAHIRMFYKGNLRFLRQFS